MKINCTRPVDCFSMDAAILVYYEQVVAPNIIFALPEKESLHTQEAELKEKTAQIQHIYEINKTHHQKQRQEQQQNKPQKQIRTQFKLDTPKSILVNKANDFDQLDCNRSEQYLLYSYDCLGCHSILGNHASPGSYGGRITNGEFGRKA